MGDLVLPIFGKVGAEEVILLTRYTVGERAAVTHLDLLVPLLFAHCFLALERIYTAHVHRQAGCGNGQRRVFRSLRDRGVDTYGPRAVGESLRIVDC